LTYALKSSIISNIGGDKIVDIIEPDESFLTLPDIQLGRSLGAKWKNYNVIGPDGTIHNFVEGTKIQNPTVFAGKGTKYPLHNGVSEGLTKEFGGNAENWQHVKGIGILVDFGEERKAEIHWFQEEKIGRVKFKVKEWLDES
jgi:hypothetical protein